MTIDTTLKQRGQDYGDFLSQSALSQDIKSTLKNHVNWDNLDPDMKESISMIVHKISRIVNGNPKKSDSWHDIAGYATLIEKRLTGKAIDRCKFTRQEGDKL